MDGSASRFAGGQDARAQLDSITLQNEVALEFEELVPDTLRSPPVDYPEMPAAHRPGDPA